jgi:ribosomal protein S27AE
MPSVHPYESRCKLLDTVEATTTDTLEIKTRVLNRTHDRCDKCGAEAFIIASKDEFELLFCGHHGAAHWKALEGTGWSIDDHRGLINEKPSPSANHED